MSLHLGPGDWFSHDGGHPTFIERRVGKWWTFWNDASGDWTPWSRKDNDLDGWRGFDQHHKRIAPPANAEHLYQTIGYQDPALATTSPRQRPGH